MSVAGALCGLGLRIVLGDAGEGVSNLVESVRDRFEDHSQALPQALERANDQAWQALAVALAGNGLLDHLQRAFAAGEGRGLRERVQGFLVRHAAAFDQTPEAFRRACLAELEKARRAGQLSVKALGAEESARQAAFPYYSDPRGVMDGAVRAVEKLATDLAPTCPHLARLLRQPTPGGPPLLVSAFAFFFRREIETNSELAAGLTFESLRQLSAGQEAGFAEVGAALSDLGGRLDAVLDQLGRLGEAVDEARDAAVAAHAAVLDLRAELRQLGSLQQSGVEEVRRLVGEAMARVSSAPPARLEGRGAAPVRDEEEEMTVRRLVARIRRLPEDQRRKVPVLLLDSWPPQPATRQPPQLYVNPVGMRFVRVAPGSFLMGSPPEEAERRGDEPQHGVTLRRAFFLAVHPVTQAQWRAVMGHNPSRFAGDDLPVENVSWDDCRLFWERLRQADGKPYRFPTEAEWEYACRAGTAGPFHCGARLSRTDANHDGGLGGRPSPVGACPANAWGLYDLHGNVFEWCADWYGDYPAEHVTDPTGPATGQVRVLRGGSWFSAPWYCRSAYRHWTEPDFRDAHVGCRACFEE